MRLLYAEGNASQQRIANTKQSKTPSNEHQSKYIYFKLIYTKCRHVLNTQLLNINYEI